MTESHRSGRRCPGHDERLRGSFGELHGVDRKRPGILIRERRIDRRLNGHFGHGTFECDAYRSRGVNGSDGLGRKARHHEAARTFGCGGHLGEGAVIVGSRLLHEGRKGRPGLGRRGIVVRYGVE